MEALEFFRVNWAIVLFVGGVITSWAYFKFTLQDHNARIVTLEKAQENTSRIVGEIKEDIAEIKTSIKFIVEKLK